ncbi:MAG: hypothetical protein VKQ33_14140 [Candidatus Sericytochromatia bacterium]|nr:hypothetical protein [Candidatus Sericytochromatia bacterium]
MAKQDTESQALEQAVDTVLMGLGLKRKQELIERDARLRPQFLGTQKVAAGKAREGQINQFLAPLVTTNLKIRALVFSAWVKDNAATLGDVPELPEAFKRDAEHPSTDEDALEAAAKDAIAALKKWLKASTHDAVNAYARLGPYEFPAKVLATVKPPKPKAAPAAEGGEGPEEGGEPVVGGVPEAVVADLRRQAEEQKAALEARLARSEEEVTKFKRLLEENKDKRRLELADATDKARAELQGRQMDWQRTEAQLRKEIAELQKSRQDATEKTTKARDELLPMRQQIERLEKEGRRATNQAQEARDELGRLREENERLIERVKGLEGAQQQLVAKEKQLERLKAKGAALALTASDNLRIWEEALAEKEVKDAFRRTFNLDTIRVNQYDHDERDLHEIWKKLLAQETDIVDRFFVLPFDELTTPSDEFRELLTNFIELKDTLVAREQLAHMLNFVGNRFLSSLKQKV